MIAEIILAIYDARGRPVSRKQDTLFYYPRKRYVTKLLVQPAHIRMGLYRAFPGQYKRLGKMSAF